jgi:hypothetical protein
MSVSSWYRTLIFFYSSLQLNYYSEWAIQDGKIIRKFVCLFTYVFCLFCFKSLPSRVLQRLCTKYHMFSTSVLYKFQMSQAKAKSLMEIRDLTSCLIKQGVSTLPAIWISLSAGGKTVWCYILPSLFSSRLSVCQGAHYISRMDASQKHQFFSITFWLHFLPHNVENLWIAIIQRIEVAIDNGI